MSHAKQSRRSGHTAGEPRAGREFEASWGNSKTMQDFLKRILLGAAQGGIDVNKVRVVIGAGEIILDPSSAPATQDHLDQELAEFKASHGEG
jgi:hypothetical protein